MINDFLLKFGVWMEVVKSLRSVMGSNVKFVYLN